MYVLKTKALISCGVTTPLICAFVFALFHREIVLCDKKFQREKANFQEKFQGLREILEKK